MEEIKKLVPFLLKHKRVEDEIVILYDEKNGNPEVLEYLLPFNIKPNVQTWRGLWFENNFADWKNKLNSYCTGDYIFQLDADEMISEYMINNIHEILKLNTKIDLILEILSQTKNSCDKMDNHIDFVNNTYKSLKAPLDYISDSFNSTKNLLK